MLPETRSSRRVFAGASLLAAVLAAVLTCRGSSAPYAPQSPPYRQKGPPGAPVLIAEFSDFECPACAAAAEPLKLLMTIYPSKIRVAFKHRPWPFHKHAKEAAVAAECAGRSGKFWEYHDELYSRRLEWIDAETAEDIFLRYAKDLGLNQDSFKSCLRSPEAVAGVDADLKEGGQHWINSTPTFFINGTRLVGAQQLRTLGRNRIEDLLKK